MRTGQQLWVRARVGTMRQHKSMKLRTMPLDVLLDTGAGGGNYISSVFFNASVDGPEDAGNLTPLAAAASEQQTQPIVIFHRWMF